MKKLAGIITPLAVLATIATAQAVTMANHGRIAELDSASKKLASSAQTTKGYPRANMDTERLRLNDLIDDLQQGKPVDPAEIDRALERADRALR
jgi:hypothetical protein